MVKKRTLNELRQEKEYGYKQPKTISNYYKVVNFDCQHVVDLIKKYQNNMELGMEIRNYYESLK